MLFVRFVRKIGKSDCRLHHVCPPVRPSAWNNYTFTGRILIKLYIWVFFIKSVDKIQISLKSDKNNGYFAWRMFHIYDNISLNYAQNKKIVQIKVVEKIKTRNLCSLTQKSLNLPTQCFYKFHMVLATNTDHFSTPSGSKSFADIVPLCIFTQLKTKHTVTVYHDILLLLYYATCFGLFSGHYRAQIIHIKPDCFSMIMLARIYSF
jgi:hypothetical protein